MTQRRLLRVLAVALAYYAGGRLGLSLAFFNSQVTALWPPTGIAVAALLTWGPGIWPGITLGALAVNLPGSDSLLTPVAISIGNTLAPLLALAILGRLSFDRSMGRLRDAGSLVSAGVVAMTVSATVGCLSLLAAGTLPGSRFGAVWMTWWTGDALGVFTVAPVLLVLLQQCSAGLPRPARMLEATALLGGTAAASWVGFHTEGQMRFLIFPTLVLAAVRFQLRGAAPAAFLTTMVATQAAATDVGWFAGVPATTAMLRLQAFSAFITMTAYLLAALTADRSRARLILEGESARQEELVRMRTQELTSALADLATSHEIAGMGSYDFDVATGLSRWSENFYRLMKMDPSQVIDLELYLSLCHPEDLDGLRTAIAHTLSTGTNFTQDHRMRRGDGSWRWFHCQGQPSMAADGTVTRLRGTATDIEDRKSAERRFSQLVELAPDAMVFLDETGRIQMVNHQANVIFGYEGSTLLGAPLELLVPAHGQALGPTSGSAAGEAREALARHCDGSEVPVEITRACVETEHGTWMAVYLRDVTERRAQQDQLAHLSVHDALTGLPNRLLLQDRLARAVGELGRSCGGSTAVIFLDIDRFKWVNDSLGHSAGDELLQVVADRLTAACRPQDTVARFGGDEFVVVSANLEDEAQAVGLAQRLARAVRSPVVLQAGPSVVPTLSIGIASTRDSGADPAALLRDADAAMYRAKERGRDRLEVFTPDIHLAMNTRLDMAMQLRTAIEEDQLCVRYQPIINLESGELVALEALARWQHPTRGLLSPAEFVELAEETGQVEAMDHSMIRLACKEFGSLLSQHPEAAHLRLNVNLSLQHLSVVRLREMLGEVLAQGRILPRQLVVEVTESADLSSEDFTGLLTAVTDLGVGVAIDDFGTGFSALSRLRGLLIDSIKVDRSFITNVHTHAHSHAIVAAVIQLAAALDATVVAEGIELPEQLSALRSLGCAKGQGWLWSPAVTITEIGQHVAARRTTGWAPYWRVGVPAQRAPAQPRSQLSKEEPVSVS